MSAHTPGPWMIFDGGYHGDHPGIEAGTFSIVVFGSADEEAGVHGNTADEELANARLIAAAPELLEALKFALVIIGDRDSHGSQVIAAAIAKAEGN